MGAKIQFLPVDEQYRKISRGIEEIIQPAELKERLVLSIQKNRPLTVKAGFDPTSPHLHIGHTVLLQKLRTFQDLGHQVVFLIGDFTGMIGDPSGTSETRKPLTSEEIERNAQTYEKQVFKVLNPDQTTVRRNSEWMNRMTAEHLIRLAGQYTLARILERDDFRNRYDRQQPISMHEFLYPLIQGYDSVVLEADIEIGGTDQKFNLLVGRDLQRSGFGRDHPLHPQVVITVPLLEGTDARADARGVLTGRKMSKMFGNTIGVDEPPRESFGKIMSINDVLMMRWYELLTAHDLKEIGQLHPKEAKKKISFELVERFHGTSEAKDALQYFEKVFEHREFPDTPSTDQSSGTQSVVIRQPSVLVDLMVELKLSKSKSEARRLIRQGAVVVNGHKMTEVARVLELGETYQIRVGKHRFVQIHMPV